jgi:hypothetical protein
MPPSSLGSCDSSNGGGDGDMEEHATPAMEERGCLGGELRTDGTMVASWSREQSRGDTNIYKNEEVYY